MSKLADFVEAVQGASALAVIMSGVGGLTFTKLQGYVPVITPSLALTFAAAVITLGASAYAYQHMPRDDEPVRKPKSAHVKKVKPVRQKRERMAPMPAGFAFA